MDSAENALSAARCKNVLRSKGLSVRCWSAEDMLSVVRCGFLSDRGGLPRETWRESCRKFVAIGDVEAMETKVGKWVMATVSGCSSSRTTGWSLAVGEAYDSVEMMIKGVLGSRLL